MKSEDPNRLGPVTREWVAALERRIIAGEDLLDRVAGDVAQLRMVVEMGYKLAGMARPATEGDGLTTQSTESPSHAGVGEAPATVGLVEHSPESAATYWREQWEKQHVELVALRESNAHWQQSNRIWHRCNNGVRDFPVDVCSHHREAEREGRDFDARTEYDAMQAELKAFRDTQALLYRQLDEAGNKIAKLTVEADSLRAQLDARPVASVKQVEAWVAGDRLPLNGEVYALPTSAVLRCATFHHEEPSKARALNRVTLNVVPEPTNGQ